MAECLWLKVLWLKVIEVKPLLINEHCIFYEFKCDLCDADCVGYTCRHLFQNIDDHEHKHYVIGNTCMRYTIRQRCT